MAASYPASLPVTAAAGANLSTNPHSTLHNNMYDEIVAIATELGTSPKGTYASVKARLDDIPVSMGRGVVGYAQAVTDQGSITGLVDRSGLTVTFTAIANRRYRTTVFTVLASSVAADIASVTIDRGGIQVQAGTLEAGLLGSSGDRSITVIHITNASISGSTTIKARVQRSSGTGSITSIAAAGAPSFILVEDIGPV